MTAGSTAAPERSLSAQNRAERVGDVTYPTRRDEAWRYAPHSQLSTLSFGPGADANVDVPAEIEAQIPALDGPRIVIVNGVVDAGRSDLANLPDGLHLATLAQAMDARPGDVAPHFESAIAEPADAFVALNAAFGEPPSVTMAPSSTWQRGRTLRRRSTSSTSSYRTRPETARAPAR